MIDIRLAREESMKNHYETDRHAKAVKAIEEHIDKQITEAVYYAENHKWIGVYGTYDVNGKLVFIYKTDITEVLNRYKDNGFTVVDGVRCSCFEWNGTISW